MKRFVAALLAAGLLMVTAGSALAQTVPERVYQPPKGPPAGRPVCAGDSTAGCRPSDVAPTNPAASSIAVVMDLGIFKGDPDGSFRPNAPMTAGEAVTVFLRVLGQNPTNATDGRHWAAPAMGSAMRAGLIPPSESDPTKPMSRMAVAGLLAKALNLAPVPGTPPWSDMAGLSADDQAILNALYLAGIFKGFPDGTFKAGEILTRAQVAILVDRVLATAAAR